MKTGCEVLVPVSDLEVGKQFKGDFETNKIVAIEHPLVRTTPPGFEKVLDGTIWVIIDSTPTNICLAKTFLRGH